MQRLLINVTTGGTILSTLRTFNWNSLQEKYNVSALLNPLTVVKTI